MLEIETRCVVIDIGQPDRAPGNTRQLIEHLTRKHRMLTWEGEFQLGFDRHGVLR
jgi:hypothetical protein